MTNRIQSPSLLRAVLAVLAFVLCSASGHAAYDCKADLAASLKLDPDAYLYGVVEDPGQTASFLTNKSVGDGPITLGRTDSGMVLRYTTIEDKATGAATTYRSEVQKKDSTLTLVVTDLGANKVISQQTLPTAGPGCFPTGQFDSINACINAFNCANQSALLCKANSTCQPQFAALTCCLKNGTAFSVHLVYRPTALRCQFRDLVPSLEGFVLSQN
jgi:hypothetical protein